MPRYKLRTLLIVLALGPPLLAGAWWGYGKWRAEQERLKRERLFQIMTSTPMRLDKETTDPFTNRREMHEFFRRDAEADAAKLRSEQNRP